MLGEQPEGCSRSSLSLQPWRELQATDSLGEDKMEGLVAARLRAELELGPTEVGLI